MEWNRGETIALAKHGCADCNGIGLVAGAPCACVLREIFRICFRRFCRNECYPLTLHSRTSLEYAADFYLVAKRSLDRAHWGVFLEHFLYGGDWRTCCRRLHIERGLFFHRVYEIEGTLGRAFREVAPYCLFPLDDYFTRHEPAVRAMGAAG